MVAAKVATAAVIPNSSATSAATELAASARIAIRPGITRRPITKYLGAGRGDRADDLCQEIVRGAAFEQGIRRQRHAVAQRGQRDVFDVVGCHVAAPVEERNGAAATDERQCAARPAANGEACVITSRPDHANRVVDNVLVHALAGPEPLEVQHGVAVEAWLDVRERQLVARLI